ncbi:M56 family metallopeptidase [Flavobacterium magnum]|nr:M56 family metallopeptidase [Flavobacterium magnum]
MTLLHDDMVKAVGWTLIHSIWQGMFLAVLAGIVILFTKKAAAVLRYNILSLLFVAFIATVAVTFSHEFSMEASSGVVQLDLPVAQQQFTSTAGTTDFLSQAVHFLNDNAATITWIWLLVFGVKMIGVFNAFGKIYRMRHYKNFEVPAYWNDRMSELALAINLKKHVLLRESVLVGIPCVTGYLKPIILLPFGMLANLPQDQVEAVLLHELAHIRRKDYFVNLLQHLAETVFFFNPGLLWVSSLVRDERENCCDDIALGVTGNKTDLVHALISFEACQSQKLSVAFAGDRKPLLQRVKRIVYDDNKSLSKAEKTFLSVCVVITGIAIIACTSPKTGDALRTSVNKALSGKIPAVQLPGNGAVRTVTQTTHQEVTTVETVQTNENTAPANETDDQAESPAPVCSPEPIVGPMPAESSTTSTVTTRTVNSKTKTAHTMDREVMAYDSENPSKNRHATLRTGITGENLPDDMNIDMLTNNIISDLINDHIITGTEGLSFRLSGNSLIVNGRKQCETVHAKLKRKYVKPKVSAICYNFEYRGDI